MKILHDSEGAMNILPPKDERIEKNPLGSQMEEEEHKDYGHAKIGKDNKLEDLKY